MAASLEVMSGTTTVLPTTKTTRRLTWAAAAAMNSTDSMETTAGSPNSNTLPPRSSPSTDGDVTSLLDESLGVPVPIRLAAAVSVAFLHFVVSHDSSSHVLSELRSDEEQSGYALWDVCTNLAISEAMQPIFLPATEPTPRTEDSASSEHTEQPVPTRYERVYTKSITKCLSHVYRQAGTKSFLRGVSCWLCTRLLFYGVEIMSLAIAIQFSPSLEDDTGLTVPTFLRDVVTQAIAAICVAIGSVAHTHIVITVPTNRYWLTRLPPFLSTIKATWLPIAICVFLKHVAQTSTTLLLKAFQVQRVASGEDGWSFYSSRLMVLAIVWAFRVSVLLPAIIVRQRIFMSLLPDGEETVVPCDLSFESDTQRARAPRAPRGILATPRKALTLGQAWASLWQPANFKSMLVLFAQVMAMQIMVWNATSPLVGYVYPSIFWGPDI